MKTLKLIAFIMPILLTGGCAGNRLFVHESVEKEPLTNVSIIKSIPQIKDIDQKYQYAALYRIWDKTVIDRDVLNQRKFMHNAYDRAIIPPGSYRVVVQCGANFGSSYIQALPSITVDAEAGKTYLITCTEGLRPKTVTLHLEESINIDEKK